MSDADGVHEVRYPECLSFGVTGGPRFNTTILRLASGYEQRNVNWSKALGRWETARVLKTQEQLDEALAFFYARFGNAYGFRFKDFTDYRFDQVVGTGTGAQQSIQLFKRYSSGGHTYDRPLQKIVAGSYRVFFDSAEQAEGSPSFVNVDTGVLTVTAGGGAAIRVAGEFDVTVRFDAPDDYFPLTVLDKTGNGELIVQGSLPIVEIRIPLS